MNTSKNFNSTLHAYCTYKDEFDIHHYKHTLPEGTKYHILYWSVEYFLSRVVFKDKQRILNKDGLSYTVNFLDGIDIIFLSQLLEANPMRQVALSFRTCPSLPPLVLIKLGDK